MWVGVQRHAPAVLPPAMIRYPLYRRLGGPCGGRYQKELQTIEVTLWFHEPYSYFEVCIAHGSQMLHIRPSRSHRWHLNICYTVAPSVVSWRERNRCQLSVAWRWHFCLTSASVAICLPTRCFRAGPRRWKSQGAGSGLLGWWSVTPQS